MGDSVGTLSTINIYAGKSSDGNSVYEELPVVRLDTGDFRLLSSPGLVLGIARDDQIKFKHEDGHYELVRRGGNICVQLYINSSMSLEVDKLVKDVTTRLDGTLDGRTANQFVFSIHVSKGFEEIEQTFNSFIASNADAEWFYGNVYDEKDGITPLNWWEQPLQF